MRLVTASTQLDCDMLRHGSARNSWLESMGRVVPVGLSRETRSAKIEVLTSLAVKELGLGMFCITISKEIRGEWYVGVEALTLNARVAGSHAETGSMADIESGHSLFQASQGILCLAKIQWWQVELLDNLGLGWECLGGAGDDLAILGETLDQPVVTAMASDAQSDAGLAKVKVAILAGRAMVVNVASSLVTAVAADGELGRLAGTLGCHLGIVDEAVPVCPGGSLVCRLSESAGSLVCLK